MTNQKGKEGKKPSSGIKGSLPKLASHVKGMDEMLNGGFPEGRTTLVSGGPGCGKSIMGLEFLCRGAQEGEPGIFVTFEERAAAVRQNAMTLGLDLEALERDGKMFLMEARVDPGVVLSGDFNVKALLAIIAGKAKEMGARKIVIDAVDMLLRLFDDPVRERNELYAIHDWLIDQGLTTLLTVKTSNDRSDSNRYEFLDFMADCVIVLDQRISDQIVTRRIRIVKYRGTGFYRNEYPFVIKEDGIRIIPISSIELEHRKLKGYFSSGNPKLDIVLGGGYTRSSSVLITGSSGTGKTTLASSCVKDAAACGKKILYLNFEESEGSFVDSMLSPGIDLRPAVKSGNLLIKTAMPESLGAEEHLIRAIEIMDEFQPDLLVVDSMSSCTRMGSEKAAFEYLMRLITGCRQRGITIMLLNQLDGFETGHEISGVGLSSLVDTVVFLRYIDVGGEINRMLLVMKSRGAKHSNQYREFIIDDHGINIAEVYVGEGGVLTGSARQEQVARESLAERIKQNEIKQKEREIALKQVELESETSKLQEAIDFSKVELEGLFLEGREFDFGRLERGGLRGGGNGDSENKTVKPAGKQTKARIKRGVK